MMKISILISVVILLCGGGFGLYLKTKIHVLKNNEKQALSTSFASQNSSPRFPRTRIPSNNFSSFLENHLKYQRDFRNHLSPPTGQAELQQNAAFYNALAALTPSELEEGITFLHQLNIPGDQKLPTLALLMSTMMDQDPSRLLTLLLRDPDYFSSDMISYQFMGEALETFGQQDPQGAIAWFNSHSFKQDDMRESLGNALLATLANEDVGLALATLENLEFKDPNQHLPGIALEIEHPDSATLFLQNLSTRNLSKEETDSAISVLLRGPLFQHVDFIIEGIEDGSLGNRESLYTSLFINLDSIEDQKPWLEYLQKDPTEDALDAAGLLIREWSHRKPEEVGEWLNRQEDGIAKNSLIKDFANSLADTEPESAVEWATTLPEGDDRANLFTSIYHSWKDDDQAAADKFAKEWNVNTEKLHEEPSPDLSELFKILEGE